MSTLLVLWNKGLFLTNDVTSSYNIEGKTTRFLLNHEGGLFSLIEGKITWGWLVALRIAEVDDNGIIDLMFSSLFFMAKFSYLRAVEWICIL